MPAGPNDDGGSWPPPWGHDAECCFPSPRGGQHSGCLPGSRWVVGGNNGFNKVRASARTLRILTFSCARVKKKPPEAAWSLAII